MKRGVVAIVGRPNVGKSTLFNRIIQKREAIVDDEPGVTRDRNYAVADWAGYFFDLIDTGGSVPGSADVIEQAVFQQVKTTIAEADVIVLIVDAVSGITGLDEEIAQIIQRSGKKALLAVNKIDNQERENHVGEFHSLGLGEPLPISAISGRRVGDFLDAVVSLLPGHLVRKEEAQQAIRLAVVGRPNVGKSSFVNAILGAEKQIVTEIPGTTRDAIDTPFKYYGQEFILVDTAGLRKPAKVREDIEYFSNVRALNAIRRCHITIVLIDAVDGMTDQDRRIIEQAIKDKKGIIIVVNKWDLIKKNTNTAHVYAKEITESMGYHSYLPIIFVSAITKQRVFKVIDVALSVYRERGKRIQTSELNDFLRDAVSRHNPPAFGKKFVKINYCTQVKIHPPVFNFYTNEPKGLKANYRQYLENRLRERFGFLGVPLVLKFIRKS